MSTIIFNTENNVSKSWADVAEGLNSQYLGKKEDWRTTAEYLRDIKDHDQQISSYVKITNKLGLYKVEGQSLAIAVASPIPGQTLGVKNLNLELIKSKLDSGISVVYFGFTFTEESVSQTEVVEKSTYFGRNQSTGILTNLETSTDFEGNVRAALWMAFYKIKDCDIYYVVINDDLIDSTIIRQEFSAVNFVEENDTYSVLNTQDGNFKEAIFAPGLDSNAYFVGNNIIATTKSTFELDVFQQSHLHKIIKDRISDENLPAADITIESSVDASINKNRITVDLGKKSTATLSYKWWTGTEIDFSKNEELKYDFVIIKV